MIREWTDAELLAEAPGVLQSLADRTRHDRSILAGAREIDAAWYEAMASAVQRAARVVEDDDA